MLAALFTFSLFWPLAIFFVICVVSAAMDSLIAPIIALIVYGIISFIFFDVNLLAPFIQSPIHMLLTVVLYALIGAAWSTFKWRGHMKSDSVQSQITSSRKHYDKDHPEGGREGFIESSYFPESATAGSHKHRLTSWIALWPFSAFLYVFEDLILNFFTKIYEALAGIYRRITETYVP